MAHTLVPSDRVEAAAVYGRDGQRIGTIERLMLEKKTGTVAYAVVKCGGFLKADIHFYPLPWSSLKYDVARARRMGRTSSWKSFAVVSRSLTTRRSIGATGRRSIGIRIIGLCRGKGPTRRRDLHLCTMPSCMRMLRSF